MGWDGQRSNQREQLNDEKYSAIKAEIPHCPLLLFSQGFFKGNNLRRTLKAILIFPIASKMSKGQPHFQVCNKVKDHCKREFFSKKS